MIWRRETSLEILNAMRSQTITEQLGIEFTRMTDSELEATMPVDHRTHQPFGLLHGGASVVLAESLGSVAGYLCSEEGQNVVGIEVNANHIRSVRDGFVLGKCRALHLGRRHQVWQIEITDSQGNLCCISRLTTAVV